MYRSYPNTQQLASKANGMLVMPLVTEAGLGLGGAYGRGALRVNDVTVDYYSVVKGSGGLQIGAQQYAHVLFFMTDGALTDFRRSPGWAAGADLEYVISDQGDSVSGRHDHRAGPGAGRGLRPCRPAHRRDAGRHQVHADHSLIRAVKAQGPRFGPILRGEGAMPRQTPPSIAEKTRPVQPSRARRLIRLDVSQRPPPMAWTSL